MIIKGGVDVQSFNAFFKEVLSHYREEKCVIFTDNAPIHHKTELQECTAVSKQTILFNAPYTPDLDPIEMFLHGENMM